ncbi:MAG: hypothetical protein V3S01_08490 [Dehalococcoidia bacterium]
MFEILPPTGAYSPPQLDALRGLMPPPLARVTNPLDRALWQHGYSYGQADAMEQGLGLLPLLPFLIAGTGATAGAVVTGWLNNDDWSIGEYNHWMRTMDVTIGGGVPGKPGGWDQLGWETGCWQKYPHKRREWQAFWALFSKHYAEHGIITGATVPPWLIDSEEKPARDLMRRLRAFGTWLNKTCGADTGTTLPTQTAAAGAPDAPPEPTDWEAIIKWGALGLGALVALSAVSTVRGAFGK